MRVIETLDPMDVNEDEVLTFDFTAGVPAGASIASVAIEVEPRTGVDLNAGNLLVGAAQVQGSLVLQRVAPTLPSVTYAMRCTATLSNGSQLVAAGYLPVVRF